MKKVYFQVVSVLSVVLAIACTSCKKDDPNAFKFDTSTVYVMPNEYNFAEAILTPSDESVVISYSVANADIAKVSVVGSKCRVDGVSAGSTVITASCNGKTATCNVLVMTKDELAQYLPDTRYTAIGKFVKVNPGTFGMGAADGADNEKPVHSVTITKPYYLGAYELTQEAWESVMGSNPSVDKGDNFPVNNITYNQILSFLSTVKEAQGSEYRLPTEAEWEYAARGSDKSSGSKFSGSNDINEVAWYDGNEGVLPHSVGTKSPNEIGLYDMSGNILELCSDKLGSYTSTSQVDPVGKTGSTYVVRGGKFDSPDKECSVTYRIGVNATDKFYNMGCRLVLE